MMAACLFDDLVKEILVMDSEYKNVVFSKHALQRLKRRKITQEAVVRTIKNPSEKESEENGNVRFVKDVNQREVHVIGNWLEDENRWIVVSAWVRGEEDPRPLWQWAFVLPYQLMRWLWRRIT